MMLMLTFLLPVRQFILQRMKMSPKRRLFITRTTIENVLDAEHLVLNSDLFAFHRHLQVSSRPPAWTLSLLQGHGGYGVLRDDACSLLGVLF